MKRCKYVNLNNPLYVSYHDNEWGKPVHDDKVFFEFLILEAFQAGLSWECILNKREAFKKGFCEFDVNKVSSFTDQDIERLMADKGIVRNRRKIEASINNAKIFLQIQKERGSFASYIWSFTNQQIVYEPYYIRTTSPLSDNISKDLKKRGMKFVGSTIVYSYLQATGIINAHGEECELFNHGLSSC